MTEPGVRHTLAALLRRRSQRSGPVGAAKLLEVHSSVAPNGDKKVLSLFIVLDKAFFRVILRVEQRQRGALGHVIYSTVLCDLNGDAVVAQVGAGLLFCHAVVSLFAGLGGRKIEKCGAGCPAPSVSPLWPCGPNYNLHVMSGGSPLCCFAASNFHWPHKAAAGGLQSTAEVQRPLKKMWV